MKNSIQLNIVFILLSFYLSGQTADSKSLKASYRIVSHTNAGSTTKNDSLITKNVIKNEVLSEYQKMLFLSSELITFELLYNSGKMIYFRKDFLIPDHLSSIQKKLLRAFQNDIFYFDFTNQTYYKHTEFLDTKYNLRLFEEEAEWEILNETKLINGYLSYKATKKNSGSSYPIAWFTPEINFQIGPSDSQFLPGLVLEYDFKIYKIYCEKIDFTLSKEDIKSIQKPKGIDISENDLKKIVDKAKQNYTN